MKLRHPGVKSRPEPFVFHEHRSYPGSLQQVFELPFRIVSEREISVAEMDWRANWQETTTLSSDQSVRITIAEMVWPDCVASSRTSSRFGRPGTSTILRKRFA